MAHVQVDLTARSGDLRRVRSMRRDHVGGRFGLERRFGTFPTQYLGANVPQAWAAGSVFHLIQAILGLHADAPNRCLYVNPILPHWLPDITLRGLAVGKDKVDLHFWREGEDSRCEVAGQEGDNIKVEERAWLPWVDEMKS